MTGRQAILLLLYVQSICCPGTNSKQEEQDKNAAGKPKLKLNSVANLFKLSNERNNIITQEVDERQQALKAQGEPKALTDESCVTAGIRKRQQVGICKYGDSEHTGCIGKQGKYYCYKSIDSRDWDWCNPKLCKPTKDSYAFTQNDCVTVQDMKNVEVRKCHFPFTYEGKQYNECKEYKTDQKRYWCSYTPEFAREHWGFCDVEKCGDKVPGWSTEGSCVTVGTIDNPAGPCNFPWTYGDKEHTGCRLDHGKYWCLKSGNAWNFNNVNANVWGYCDESLCPPTYIDRIKEFAVNSDGWIWMYRRMSKRESEYVFAHGGLFSLKSRGQIWITTSLMHSRQFENMGVVNNQDDVVIAFKVNIDCFIEKFNGNLIDAHESGQFNQHLKLENLKCLVNNELLLNHKWGKFNFCLSGNHNAAKFNTCILQGGLKKLMIKKENGKTVIYDEKTEIESETDGHENCF